MQDFNHPDPQNDRRMVQPTNSEPVPNTQQQVPPPIPSTNQVPPVPPADSATQINQQPYQAPQQQYQAPQQNSYQQPQQQYQQPQQPYQQPNQQQQYQTPIPPVVQPTYQQQYQQQNRVQQTAFPPVKIGEWMLTMFLMSIPLIGSIMLFVWAFSSGTNPSKANWAKATLIWGVIAGILIVIVYAIIFLIAGITFTNFNL
jgi:hypothetical protein